MSRSRSPPSQGGDLKTPACSPHERLFCSFSGFEHCIGKIASIWIQRSRHFVHYSRFKAPKRVSKIFLGARAACRESARGPRIARFVGAKGRGPASRTPGRLRRPPGRYSPQAPGGLTPPEAVALRLSRAAPDKVCEHLSPAKRSLGAQLAPRGAKHAGFNFASSLLGASVRGWSRAHTPPWGLGHTHGRSRGAATGASPPPEPHGHTPRRPTHAAAKGPRSQVPLGSGLSCNPEQLFWRRPDQQLSFWVGGRIDNSFSGFGTEFIFFF